MQCVTPAALLTGVVLLTIPHMDDGVLACGGTIAQLPEKERLHLVYASDGRASPVPPARPFRPRPAAAAPDLATVRMAEARAAMGYLGVRPENIHFWGLPDGRLRQYQALLRQRLGELVSRLEPEIILTPFRYDRHPDHLALNQAVMSLWREGCFHGRVIEYFVYYRWRLLPGGDVRRYIRPDYLLQVETTAATVQKRAALDYFRSQTTRFYPWQTRPNLTPQLLDEVSRTPELFLRDGAFRPGTAVFTRLVPWIRLAHRLEPALKRWKDALVALAKSVGRVVYPTRIGDR